MAKEHKKLELPPFDIRKAFDVTKTGPHSYLGVAPLTKPSQATKGAYGGNTVAQAILVALRASPAGFTPNSIHSFFIKAVNDKEPVSWQVEEISNGKTFVNRFIRGYQGDTIVFTASVSLTKNNSTLQNAARNNKNGLNFSIPPNNTMQAGEFANLPVIWRMAPLNIYQKIYSHQSDPETVTFVLRLGIKDDPDYHEPLTNVDNEFKYVGVTALTDWMALDFLLPHLDVDVRPKVQASIDHSVYYHEDDFDVDDWFIYVLSMRWAGNDRALLKGDVYTSDKRHVMTVVQERLHITSPKL
ncbi:uncharacterized protein LODBEIA_P01400 [Lodderomyces beijingensis]|uniref:Acyl-CoA thioesterase II n=1 Tax=Lodderomyces beijingensis TaxID=1775926 RepID=A0ABP0ZFG1_9ASCO